MYVFTYDIDVFIPVHIYIYTYMCPLSWDSCMGWNCTLTFHPHKTVSQQSIYIYVIYTYTNMIWKRIIFTDSLQTDQTPTESSFLRPISSSTCRRVVKVLGLVSPKLRTGRNQSQRWSRNSVAWSAIKGVIKGGLSWNMDHRNRWFSELQPPHL